MIVPVFVVVLRRRRRQLHWRREGSGGSRGEKWREGEGPLPRRRSSRRARGSAELKLNRIELASSGALTHSITSLRSRVHSSPSPLSSSRAAALPLPIESSRVEWSEVDARSRNPRFAYTQVQTILTEQQQSKCGRACDCWTASCHGSMKAVQTNQSSIRSPSPIGIYSCTELCV